MIDLSNLRFYYDKDEVDEYLTINKGTIEELLQVLIEGIKKYARVPVSNFQVGAGFYTKSGRIFLGTNIEVSKTAINHTVHAEQCALSNMYLHTVKDGGDWVSIIAVTETPCGHCRQILQELPNAGNVRVIVKSQQIDCNMSKLLPYSFELPMNGIVYHLFESSRITEVNALLPYVPSIAYELFSEQIDMQLSQPQWSRILEEAVVLYSESFGYYSGSGCAALFLTKDGSIANGCSIESSAYNPTVNCCQMAIVDCQVKRIKYEDICMIVMFESKQCLFSYRAYGEVLSTVLNPTKKMQFVYKSLNLFFVCLT